MEIRREKLKMVSKKEKQGHITPKCNWIAREILMGQQIAKASLNTNSICKFMELMGKIETGKDFIHAKTHIEI